MQDCIFCKIIKGEVPSSKVYENDKVLAFLDINPRTKGHTVIIPKKHYETIDKMPKDEVGVLFEVVQEIGKIALDNLGAKGFNIGSNSGEMAGQVIPHVHIHVIPRYKDEKEHYGFEAAFPVKEELKAKINEVLKEFGQAKVEEKKEEVKEEPEGKKPKKKKWYFLED